MPPPDPNRQPRAERPPKAAPDALDTPAYLAPTPPPSETEHKTFELQTVKVRQEETGEQHQNRVARESHQADIPTAPSTRVQRRRSWTVAAVLAALGVVAGIGLLAMAHLTRVEPLEPGTPMATEATTAAAVAVAAPVESTEAAEPAVEASALPVKEASDAPGETLSGPGAGKPKATAGTASPRHETPKKVSERMPGAEASAKGTTSSVPLGPPEF